MISKFVYALSVILHFYTSYASFIVPIVTPHEIMRKYILPSSIYVNVSRIIVIADVHDDLERLKRILENAKIINKSDDWIAEPNTIVIQLGDQIDRKPIDDDDIPDKHHFRVVKYTEYLRQSALDTGSDFISLIGNHENNNIEKIRSKPDIQNIISRRPIVAILNNFLFCHGGYHMDHHKYLRSYHKNIRDLNDIWYKYVYNMQLKEDETNILNNLILDRENSILYTRHMPSKYENRRLFHDLRIQYMFVGHQETQNLFLRNGIWYLDQILRQAFDTRAYNYIDIHDDNITIKSLQ